MRYDYREQIKRLAAETKLTNTQIARKLGCSPRTVRRNAGPYSSRLEQFFGITPEQLKTEGARILLFDIETAPMEVFVWSLRQHGWISPESIQKDWSILTWSAKWLFEDQIYSARVNADDAEAREDYSIMPPLWDLLDEADIIVAHNGARFDVRKANARFVLNGLSPPLPYKIVDTLRITKRQFDFSSYKLDYVNQLFGIDQKTHPGYDTWKRAVKKSVLGGDVAEQNLEKMRVYCDNDVRILEELYMQIRPWIKGHPNMGLYIDTDGNACTNCGNTDLDWAGKYYTPAGRFLSFRCKVCGAVGRSRTTDIDKEERKRLCLGVV
jgi:hypothetical protein